MNISCLRERQFVWLSVQENNRLYLRRDALYRCEDVKRQYRCSVGRLGQAYAVDPPEAANRRCSFPTYPSTAAHFEGNVRTRKITNLRAAYLLKRVE